jgi:hypothetical protein
VKSEAGEERSIHGSFELCAGGSMDATALVGKPVTLDLGKEEVLAGSCEGNPECSDRETVDFVKKVTAAP